MVFYIHFLITYLLITYSLFSIFLTLGTFDHRSHMFPLAYYIAPSGSLSSYGCYYWTTLIQSSGLHLVFFETCLTTTQKKVEKRVYESLTLFISGSFFHFLLATVNVHIFVKLHCAAWHCCWLTHIKNHRRSCYNKMDTNTRESHSCVHHMIWSAVS